MARAAIADGVLGFGLLQGRGCRGRRAFTAINPSTLTATTSAVPSRQNPALLCAHQLCPEHASEVLS